MQTTASRKQKRFDHQQIRLLALIIGLVAAVAIIAVALAVTRTGDNAEQGSAVIVTTQPPFSETLDKGMLSPSVGLPVAEDPPLPEGWVDPYFSNQQVVVPVAEDPPLPEGWVDPYFTRHDEGSPTFPPTVAE